MPFKIFLKGNNLHKLVLRTFKVTLYLNFCKHLKFIWAIHLSEKNRVDHKKVAHFDSTQETNIYIQLTHFAILEKNVS